MIMTPSPKSPASSTGGHKRGHAVHPTLDSLEGIHALRTQSNECSPLVPRDVPPPSSSSSSSSSPAGERRGRSSSFPLHPKSDNDAPICDEDADAIAGMDMVVKNETKKGDSFVYYVIYAFVNSIMCVPCLYGYAAVIFAHDVFQPHINALSKLVILSSVVHQICFSAFSTLPFAIGQVQDAGLIFQSAMSHSIATTIISDAGGHKYIDDDLVAEIVSTTVVMLGLSTAFLGAVLILAGKFRFANAVAFLPLPVVGGYLAFIGYFCVEAGVALCIGTTIMKPSDWLDLCDVHHLLLAFPGIVAGVVLTLVARKCDNEAMLPLSMVLIPATFYSVLLFSGSSIDDAREGGWVGQESPPVPVRDLFHLVDFGLVRWGVAKQLISTWAGMVFVVSFSSCLDVAAISMDMGEALDTNSELMTVGISNFVSGIFGGFAGSYIFSQTIFTYRTGCRSRWVGVLVAFTFIAVVVSTVNFLEVTPLFFLGSTLIFIGFDLLYEWIVDVRHKLLISEYIVLLATFFAIQFVGIDGGIGLGIAVAIFDFVWTTASVSNVARVARRSIALWSPRERTFVENHVYSASYPKIITLELRGSVFFGSSMQILSTILEEIGINISVEEKAEIGIVNSPLPKSRINSVRIPSSLSPASVSPGSRGLEERRRERARAEQPKRTSLRIAPRVPPRFLVLDLSSVSNVDASAARGCFLQLARICARREIVVCAAGANSRIDWIMQTHGTAQHADVDGLAIGSSELNDKIILFNDVDEALQFCEKKLVAEAPTDTLSFVLTTSPDTTGISLSTAFTTFLGLEAHDAAALIDYEKRGKAFHSEDLYNAGETVFSSGAEADGFFVVLSGSVVILLDDRSVGNSSIRSGAGVKHVKRRNVLESGQISRVLSVGAVFGFVDFVLKRPRTFTVVAWRDSLVAKCHRSGLNELKRENTDLERIVDKVLLLCSVVELAARDP